MQRGALTRDQLIAQIVFQISDLSARNGHHEFEEMCRHLAHQRIAPNVIPATGPVAAGGDQGRDFETFHSYIGQALGDAGWFAGMVADGPIVGVCTLQKDSIASKILGDVEAVCTSEPKPERIYAFLGNDLTVARRHEIIDEARERHSVELDILDARGIAEQLADFDTFWITVRYLSLPEEFAPPRPAGEGDELPSWYAELRERWRATPLALPVSPAELVDLRDGLRYATFEPQARADLAFWLDLVRVIADQDADADLRQRARYEVIVASIRGLGDLRTLDGHVDSFLAAAGDADDAAGLEDAAVVLSYATTAATIGHCGLDLGKLGAYRLRLRERADLLLADETAPVRRARLLQVAGHLALTPDGERSEPGTGPAPSSAVAMLDEPPEAVPAEAAARMAEITDVDDALQYWTELARAIPDTPLFPVDDFARIVGYLTPLLVDASGWSELVDALDDAIARVAGGDRAAEACRDRGVALYESGRTLAALQEIHRASTGWWTGDTLRGALLALAFIAKLYRELRLPMAAKQYALVIAGAAQSTGREDLADLVPAGMLLASEISYQSGDWIAALEELEIGTIAAYALGQDNADNVTDLSMRALFTAAMCLRGARELAPELVTPVQEVLQRTGMLDPVTEVLAEAEALSADEWKQRSDRDLLGRPFSDAGEEYVIRFAALGTRWTLRCANDYADVRATQRLAAASEIALAEMAAADLCLMPTDIDVRVAAVDAPPQEMQARVRSLPSNDGRLWEIQLTDRTAPNEAQDPEEVLRELLSAITALLMDVSLLPTDDYMSAVRDAFERGLLYNLAIGRPFDEVAAIVPADRFAASPRGQVQPPLHDDVPAPVEHPQLGWQSGPGPGFTEQEAVEMAATRYQRITSMLPATLDRLRQDAAFQELVAGLRHEGWLNWHILTAVYNIAANYRLAEAGLNTYEAVSTREGQEAARKLTQTQAVDAGAPIPLTEFDETAIRRGRLMGIAPLVQNWGLQSRQRTPDYPAVERVLAERFGYWSIDADHDDPFAAPPQCN